MIAHDRPDVFFGTQLDPSAIDYLAAASSILEKKVTAKANAVGSMTLRALHDDISSSYKYYTIGEKYYGLPPTFLVAKYNRAATDFILHRVGRGGPENAFVPLPGMPLPVSGVDYVAIPLGLGDFATSWQRHVRRAGIQTPEFQAFLQRFQGVGAFAPVPIPPAEDVATAIRDPSVYQDMEQQINDMLGWAMLQSPSPSCNPDIRSIASLQGATVMIAATSQPWGSGGKGDEITWMPIVFMPWEDDFLKQALSEAEDVRRRTTPQRLALREQV